ncbi:hypothetical protein D1007_22537 [Hordeum vulgare]|nr:hypothetical protein D1007_22537 [Hordeum vulgare]
MPMGRHDGRGPKLGLRVLGSTYLGREPERSKKKAASSTAPIGRVRFAAWRAVASPHLPRSVLPWLILDPSGGGHGTDRRVYCPEESVALPPLSLPGESIRRCFAGSHDEGWVASFKAVNFFTSQETALVYPSSRDAPPPLPLSARGGHDRFFLPTPPSLLLPKGQRHWQLVYPSSRDAPPPLPLSARGGRGRFFLPTPPSLLLPKGTPVWSANRDAPTASSRRVQLSARGLSVTDADGKTVLCCRSGGPAGGAPRRARSRSVWKIDGNTELNIAEDFDNRPTKKAKISESDVLESSAMLTSTPLSDCFESIVPESDIHIDHDPLPSTLAPSSSTLSPVFSLHDVNEPDLHKEIKVDEKNDPGPSSPTISSNFPLHDFKDPDSNKEIKDDQLYYYLPQEYTLTDHDLCAHIAIESHPGKKLLVQIDGSIVLQKQLMCLLDEKEWVNDDVINAYICCIKDQIHVQNDNSVYFENPFVTSLFKRDGECGIQQDSAFMTELVTKYMKHDMTELPINTNNTHWYLAILNTKKLEIQVLDSLCWKFDREDLTITLRGIQFHLDHLKSHDLVSDDWKDVDLTEWKITEQLQKPIQKDSSSCGLFMVKFMEYFTGCAAQG